MLRIHGHHDRGALVGEGCVHVGARALASRFAARARRQGPSRPTKRVPRLARYMELSEAPFQCEPGTLPVRPARRGTARATSCRKGFSRSGAARTTQRHPSPRNDFEVTCPAAKRPSRRSVSLRLARVPV